LSVELELFPQIWISNGIPGISLLPSLQLKTIVITPVKQLVRDLFSMFIDLSGCLMAHCFIQWSIMIGAEKPLQVESDMLSFKCAGDGLFT
jgi:hypothetical protein